MDRMIVYPGAIPLDTDLLNIQRFAMLADGAMAEALIGDTMTASGLAAAPTSPASLSITVGRGAIFALATVDGSSFGSLGSDSNGLVKIGYNEGATTETFTAPGTSGQSINYLIEATFQESDTDAVVLPYYNASNPAVPYTGPANAGTSQNTQRIQRVELQVKAGAAATTGSQTTPAVDSGWVPLYVVTVAYGQTTITSGNIVVAPGAPFVGGGSVQTGRLIGHQVFSASGTYTPTVGARSAYVQVLGGGGAGGGAGATGAGQCAAGSGGGGGGYAESWITGGMSAQTVTVGAGGAGVANAAGGNGGNSSFGSLLAGGGGTGGSLGLAASASTVNFVGGAGGGYGTGGNISNAEGDPGSPAFYQTLPLSGTGGSSRFGGGAFPASGTSSGNSATSPGAGGSGGSLVASALPAAGGSGAAGLVVVWEYS